MKAQYLVFGWLNGDDYDAGKPPSHVTTVTASSEGEAENKGEKKISEKCDVIVAELA